MTPAPGSTLLFIYGTLKRGAANHAVLADQTYVADASTVPGYRLLLVADYPGMVRDPADRRGVQGEIWSVSPDALRRLDDFEGVPERLYRRGRVSLTPPHEDLAVESYLYLRNIRGRRPIISGIWPASGRLIP